MTSRRQCPDGYEYTSVAPSLSLGLVSNFPYGHLLELPSLPSMGATEHQRTLELVACMPREAPALDVPRDACARNEYLSANASRLESPVSDQPSCCRRPQAASFDRQPLGWLRRNGAGCKPLSDLVGQPCDNGREERADPNGQFPLRRGALPTLPVGYLTPIGDCHSSPSRVAATRPSPDATPSSRLHGGPDVIRSRTVRPAT